jgi:hypothetical protein
MKLAECIQTSKEDKSSRNSKIIKKKALPIAELGKINNPYLSSKKVI